MTHRANITKWQRPCPREAPFPQPTGVLWRTFSLHPSKSFLVFLNTRKSGTRSQGSQLGGGGGQNNNIQKNKSTLHNYSSLTAPQRSTPMSSSWQRLPVGSNLSLTCIMSGKRPDRGHEALLRHAGAPLAAHSLTKLAVSTALSGAPDLNRTNELPSFPPIISVMKVAYNSLHDGTFSTRLSIGRFHRHCKH